LNNVAKIPGFAPAPAYEEQEKRFAKAFDVLSQAISQRAFPSASIAVTHKGQLVCLKGFGHFVYEMESPEVTAASIYDLASLTKVLATTSLAMILCDRGLLDLEMPLVKLVPEIKTDDIRRERITLRMLLAHSSGLPAYEKLYLRAQGRDEVFSAACATPLAAEPGSQAEYSDIGFIILGAALERLADELLDRFCQREVFGRLGMAHTGFDPPLHWWSDIPPTQDDQAFRHRIIQAEVQDENASAMEGVAGHAGVFSSAEDVAIFANIMLHGGAPIVRPETLAVFTKRQTSPAGTSRALGWDTPSTPSQSGQYFSARSFGHLGYTGTSLWIDPEREVSITMLTNRTWPDCKNDAIKQVRPKFHDAILEALKDAHE
jgi:serine-type D-Ala-D-Ala carboxypeptidase